MNHDNEGGLSTEQIAGSAFNAFRFALDGKGAGDQPMPHWQGLGEDVQAAWVAVAGFAAAGVEQNEDRPVSVPDFAKQCYESFARSVGHGRVPVDWTILDTRQQIAWQAAFRHIVNCLSFDSVREEDMDSHERGWRKWAEHRLSLAGGK